MLEEVLGTSFAKVGIVYTSSTTFKVIGYIDDFYTVVLSNGTVGMIKKSLVKLSYKTTTTTTETQTLGTTDEKLVLELINKAREDAGLEKLTMGVKLLKIARLKADDMVNNSYFSHTSPTYGSPFNMMKTYSISYTSAGENIAGNPSLEGAVNAWLASSTHKENLLSKDFNYAGIGIAKSSTYGYIVVAMFAEV